MAGIRDVAALAGVSVATVSNVLNRPEVVAKKTITRVEKAISELGFVRNGAARQLRIGHSRSIGLIVLDAGNPFFNDVARGAEDRATHEGLTVFVGNSAEDDVRESAYLTLFEEQRVAGVLVTPVGDARSRLLHLRERGIPAVLVDRQADDSTFPSVAVDDIAGGRLAAQHLVEIGRCRIAFVGGPPGLRQVDERLRGAQEFLGSRNLTMEVLETQQLTVQQGRDAGMRILGRPATARPDAVFAANDLVAIGVLQALTTSGDVRVPDDIALIGYDDIAFASSSVVPLSSVRQPGALIGATAVDMLMREIDGKDIDFPQVLFQPTLIARLSTSTSKTH